MTTIDLVYFNAGGGHRASALALQAVLGAHYPHWQVRLVNLIEVIDSRGHFERLTGLRPEDIYNLRLKRGWTLGLAQELKVLQAMIRVSHPLLLNLLQQHWLRTEPDLVVSLIPNFNRALHESLGNTLPGVPYVSLLTDLADLPPHFWIEPQQRQHFICGTPRAVAQARALGHPAERVHATSGMVLHPDFYRPVELDREAECRRRGLDPAQPIGLVTFGGHGSRHMLPIAQALAGRQLILVCGHNEALERRLHERSGAAQHHIVGFTHDMARLLRLADYVIGKPGPGSLSEAAQLGRPVIVTRNAWTMPQERYNTDWVRDNDIGLVLRSLRDIGSAVEQLLARLPELQANLRRLDNQAVFEIPALLQRILDEAAQDRPPEQLLHRLG